MNQISHENKILHEENIELKEECDRLEQAYEEIIEQFTKMNNVQKEIMEMTSMKQKN